jgi:hypothetical protein
MNYNSEGIGRGGEVLDLACIALELLDWYGSWIWVWHS